MRGSAIIALVLASLLAASTSFAAKSIDLTGSIATDPDDNFGVGFGATGGMSLDLADFAATSDITKNLQLRGDISYFHWSDSEEFFMETVDFSYRRIPVFMGARY